MFTCHVWFGVMLAVVGLSMAMGAETTSPTTTGQVPKGWVRIPAKGQSFQMGQEFPGKRWTYTFPAHKVSFLFHP